MAKKSVRQIRWNRESEEVDRPRDTEAGEYGSEVHHYYFFIIMPKAEVEQRKQYLFETMKPILNHSAFDSGIVPNTNSRLSYMLLTLDAAHSRFEPHQIYRGEFKRDPRLNSRADLGNYVNQRLSELSRSP